MAKRAPQTILLWSKRTWLTSRTSSKNTALDPFANNRPHFSSGFTLVEVLITMAIIVMVMSVGIPAISRVTYQRINSQTRQFVGIMRTVRSESILLNRIHRFAIDLDHSTWWVEIQMQGGTIVEEDEKTRKKIEEARKKDPKAFVAAPGFGLAEKFSKKPLPLPQGVVFDGVLKEKEGLIKTGIVYVHFFPSGYAEKSIVYLNKEGASSDGYSIVLRSITGRVDVATKKIKSFDEEF